MPSPHPRRLQIAAIGTSVFLTALLTIILGEIWFRIFKPEALLLQREADIYFGMMEYDPAIGRILKPNLDTWVVWRGGGFRVKTNSHGLRNDEVPHEKTPGTFRIMTLGDSFTMGYGVEQTEMFPALLEEKFSRGNPPKVEIVNAGVSGWGTTEAASYFAREGTKFSPDLVILAFFWNDVGDNFARRNGSVDFLASWKAIREQRNKALQERPLTRLNFALREFSYFYLFLEDRVGKASESLSAFALEMRGLRVLGGLQRPDYEVWNTWEGGLSFADLEKVFPSDGEITSWQVLATGDAENQIRLKVWRPSGKDEFELIGQSDLKQVVAGPNSFELAAPISVRKGDILGLYTKLGRISRQVPYAGRKRYANGDGEKLAGASIEDSSGNYNFAAIWRPISVAEQAKQLQAAVEQAADEQAADEQAAVEQAAVEQAAVEQAAVEQGADEQAAAANLNREAQEKTPARIVESAAAVFLDSPDANTLEAWKATFTNIDLLRSSVEASGAKLVVAYLPWHQEVGNQLMDLDPPDGRSDPGRVRSELASGLKQRGIDFIDLTPSFKAANADQLFLSDGHYNARGHEVAAESLFQSTRRHVWNETKASETSPKLSRKEAQ